VLRSMPFSTAFPLQRHLRKVERPRNYFLFLFRGGARASGSDKTVSRIGRSAKRQLFCGSQLGCVHRRFFLFYSEGRPLSHGAFYVFSHQCCGHGSIRAHIDRCGGRAHTSVIWKDARLLCGIRTSCMQQSWRSFRMQMLRLNIRRYKTGIPGIKKAAAGILIS